MDRSPSIAVKTGAARPKAPQAVRRRSLLAGPLVAACTGLVAIVATSEAGVPLRDPADVASRRFVTAVWLVVFLMALDVIIRAVRSSGTRRPSPAALGRAWRERWTPARLGAVALALVSFYVTYLAYRNLKSVVPLLRPDELFDRELGDLDRSLFFGHDPAALLHSVSGSGISAHFLSAVYGLFFAFVPFTIAFALVVLPDLQAGLFYVTALSLNWALAAGSYFLLPSLGPIYADPAGFADLPATAVSHLQDAAAAGARRVPARRGRPGRRAEHRRLRVAARLDLLHRRAGDPPARAGAGRQDRRLGPVRLDRHRHALLRLALRSPTTSPASPSPSRRSPSRVR